MSIEYIDVCGKKGSFKSYRDIAYKKYRFFFNPFYLIFADDHIYPYTSKKIMIETTNAKQAEQIIQRYYELVKQNFIPDNILDVDGIDKQYFESVRIDTDLFSDEQIDFFLETIQGNKLYHAKLFWEIASDYDSFPNRRWHHESQKRESHFYITRDNTKYFQITKKEFIIQAKNIDKPEIYVQKDDGYHIPGIYIFVPDSYQVEGGRILLNDPITHYYNYLEELYQANGFQRYIPVSKRNYRESWYYFSYYYPLPILP